MEQIQKWLTGEGGILKVRAWLALGTTGVMLCMWASEIAVSSEQLIIVTAIITHYFAGRTGDKMADIASEENRRMDGVLDAWETPEPADDTEPDHSGG